MNLTGPIYLKVMFSVMNLADFLPLINFLLDMKQNQMDSPLLFAFSANLETSEAFANCRNELYRSYLPLDHVFRVKFGRFVAPDQLLTGHPGVKKNHPPILSDLGVISKLARSGLYVID